MAAAIQLDTCRDEFSGESYLPGRVVGKSSGGGGDMDNVLQRLGTVESSVSTIRVEVSGIAAQIPHLATKEDLKEVKGQINTITAQIPNLATKEDLKEVKGQVNAITAQIPHLATKEDLGLLRAAMNGMETKLIRWTIATFIAVAGVAFSIAKLVH